MDRAKAEEHYSKYKDKWEKHQCEIFFSEHKVEINF